MLLANYSEELGVLEGSSWQNWLRILISFVKGRGFNNFSSSVKCEDRSEVEYTKESIKTSCAVVVNAEEGWPPPRPTPSGLQADVPSETPDAP